MTVTVDLVRGRIWVTAPYPIARLGNDVPGAYFSKNPGPHWSASLTLDTCFLLRERFGTDLKITKKLADWAREEIAKERQMTALASNVSADLPRLAIEAPALAGAVSGRPYQTIAARFVAEGQNVLLADTPGLGKTLEVLAGIVESGVVGPYLIVAPKTATEVVWGRETKKWLPKAKVRIMPEGRAAREKVLDELPFDIALHPNLFVVVHPQMMQTKAWWDCKDCGSETPVKAYKELVCEHSSTKGVRRIEPQYPQLFDIEWGAVVADEADQCLLRKNGTPTQTRLGMEIIRDSVRPDGLRIAATGTPFRGRPHLIWGTLNWLRPKDYKGFWAWAETHYDVKKGFGGSRHLGELKREDLLYRSLGGIMLRRTKQEVAGQLPPKLYIDNRVPAEQENLTAGVWLPMEPKQEKAYRQMAETSEATVDGGELSAVGILAEMTRLQQLASSLVTASGDPTLPSNKYEWLMQHLHEAGYPDDPQYKIVIVSRFTRLLKMLVVGAAMGGVMITGDVTGRNRTQAVDEFNGTPLGQRRDLCFLNTKAGGVAITLDAADEMIFLDRTFVPDDQEQAEERINNRRPEEKVLQRRYIYLGSKGTVDEAIAGINDDREHSTKTILDSRRGVHDWALKAMRST